MSYVETNGECQSESGFPDRLASTRTMWTLTLSRRKCPGDGLFGESARKADANNDGENSFHSGVQRANDSVEFLFTQ